MMDPYRLARIEASLPKYQFVDERTGARRRPSSMQIGVGDVLWLIACAIALAQFEGIQKDLERQHEEDAAAAWEAMHEQQ